MDGSRAWVARLVAIVTLVVASIVILLVVRWTPAPLAPNLVSGPLSLVATGSALDFTLRSFGGPLMSLSDFRGKMVVLNFWASWCAPCREEMPNLERAWQEFRTRGMVVLGIDVADDHDEAAVFLKTLAITYPNVFDPEQTRLRQYRVTGLPTTFFIDPQMQIRKKVPGGYVGPAGYARLRQEIAAVVPR